MRTWTFGRLAAVAPLLLTSACGNIMCANTIVSRMVSADGRTDAVVFSRDCGATTGYSTQISLVRAGQHLPNRPGNVFIAADSLEVNLQWVGSDTLIVRQMDSNPVLKATEVKDITIRYETLP